MTFANKSNVANKSALSNKSNKSVMANKSTDEYDHAGDEANPMLSAALDATAVALASEVPSNQRATPKQRNPFVTPDYFEALNARHLSSLLLNELQAARLIVESKRFMTVNVLDTRQNHLITLDLNGMDANDWQEQFDKVRRKTWQRDERLSEIFLQRSDMLSFFGVVVPIDPNKTPYTLLLLNVFIEAIAQVEVQVKARFNLQRPNEVCSDIHPVIQTPAHSSFPSGHATESYAFATILNHLFFQAQNKKLCKLAHRISDNRVFAGLHYPIDEVGGSHLGITLAKYYMSVLFNGLGFAGDVKVDKDKALPNWTDDSRLTPNVGITGKSPVTQFIVGKVAEELTRIKGA